MKESITATINRYLPKTLHQPHVLLRSNRSLVQLYTNYPCVTGLSAEVCAQQFNQNKVGMIAHPHGNFINFVLEPDFAEAQIADIAQAYAPAKEALPDVDLAAYLSYVISVIAEMYPSTTTDLPYTKQETELAVWIVYLSEQPQANRQKRKAEFITRLSALLNTYILSNLTSKQKQLLLAAATILNPQT